VGDSGRGGSAADLFATIHSALPESERAKRLKDLLADYAQLAIPALTVIPVVQTLPEA
jgi:hypothetical protein